MDAPRASRVRPLVLALVGLAFVFHALATSGWVIDDAYISFRYARNLAEGAGLVFNPGERVEGYTNFCWTVLSALVVALRGSPAFVMPVVGALAGLALVLVVAHEARRIAASAGRETPWAGVPAAVLVAASADVARYAVSGLETVLFALLLTVAVASALARRPVRFAIATALAFLTRPEAGLVGVLGLALLASARSRGRDEDGPRSLRPALIATAILASIVLPYLAWKQVYFGTIVPNTLHAKTPDLRAGLEYVGRGTLPLLGVLAAAGVGVATTGLRSDAAKYLGLWAILSVAVVLEGGDWMEGHRMLVPALPLLFVAADETLARALSRPRSRADVAKLAVAVASFAFVPLQVRRTVQLSADADDRARIDRERVALYRALAASGVRSIGTFDIGLLGWVARDARILDLGGLTDRTIARSPGHYYDKQPSVEYLASRAPEAFLFTSSLPPMKDPAKGLILIPSHYECEDYLKSLPWFRQTYRYRDSFALEVPGGFFLHWFTRA